MKLIIAGGRDRWLEDFDLAALDKIHKKNPVTEVVSGKCPTGADAGGEMWAKVHGIRIKEFPANWKKYHLAAGPIRNKEMAKYADAVALFAGQKGTASMRREAKKAGILIIEME